mmetsp:Transcript_106699/g.217677  ORF Transcript_106699/g.217677 Transcript_106699/m.217677 type:complete len:80 (-) Transcript_106699:2-241(-)
MREVVQILAIPLSVRSAEHFCGQVLKQRSCVLMDFGIHRMRADAMRDHSLYNSTCRAGGNACSCYLMLLIRRMAAGGRL